MASAVCLATPDLVLLPAEVMLLPAAAQVPLATAASKNEVKWVADFPDYPSWMQLRLQHLQQDPSDWPAVLVKRAVAAYGLRPQPDGSMSSAADVARQLTEAGRAAALARAAGCQSPSVPEAPVVPESETTTIKTPRGRRKAAEHRDNTQK